MTIFCTIYDPFKTSWCLILALPFFPLPIVHTQLLHRPFDSFNKFLESSDQLNIKNSKGLQ